MDNHREKKEQSFIREHIVPQKNARKVVAAIFATIGLALLFGAVFGVAFFVSQRVMEDNTPTQATFETIEPISRDEEQTTAEPEPTEETTEEGSLEESDEAPEEVNIRTVYKKVKDGLLRVVISTPKGETMFGTEIVTQKTTFGIIVAESGDYVYAIFDGTDLTENSKVTATLNGVTANCEVSGSDGTTGISALRILKKSLQEAYKVIELGNSFLTNTMDDVYMIGAQTGGFVATDYGIITYATPYEDIVDGYRRRFYTNNSRETGTASALFNEKGEVIGWVTDHVSDAEHNSIALGISSVKYIIEDVCSGRKTAYLGIQGRTLSGQEAVSMGLSTGFYVERIVSDSPAERAGLQVGDKVLAIGGTNVNTSHSLQDCLDELTPGDSVVVKIGRRVDEQAEKQIEINVIIGERP